MEELSQSLGVEMTADSVVVQDEKAPPEERVRSHERESHESWSKGRAGQGRRRGEIVGAQEGTGDPGLDRGEGGNLKEGPIKRSKQMVKVQGYIS
jgi:hypothetical protein